MTPSLAALALLAPLSACGGGEVVEAGDVTVLVGEDTGAGMDALLSGELTVIDGCLGVRQYVVIWPHGTDVTDDDPLTIEVPDLGTFTLGDTVELGGGEVSTNSDTSELDGVTVPEDCAGSASWLASE